jgi:enoyl-CoA hydratase/carnithine racemase
MAAAIATADAARSAPRASVSLVNLLRITGQLSIMDGLVAESAVYSMLLAGGEFARWLATHPRPATGDDSHAAVVLDRTGATLGVTLDRPLRRNAFNRAMRDELIAAFDLAAADPLIERVVLGGAGTCFCSGGDLAEFGTSADVSTAHLIRLDRSVALRIDRCQDRVVAHLHGACVGAGIEIPSFAGRVVARPDAFFQLPEVAMGLVPGAGGTVGITRRIGRWRTAYLALSGVRLDASTALDWGLVDAVADEWPE